MLRLIAAIVVALCVEAAGAATNDASVPQIAVIDATGARVALAAPARRIVSLAPHATELLFAAGAGDRVVGVLSPADWPPEAGNLPRVGDARALDLERIVALKPDLAVAWPYLAPAQIELLRELGLPVYVSDPHSPEAIAQDIERIGALAGSAEAATARAASFRAKLRALRAAPQDRARLPVFYEIWNQPLYTIGGKHLITAALDLCGGRNVFAGLALPAPQVSLEAVLVAAPEAIIAGTDDAVRPAWLDDWKRWSQLPAVAHGNLFVVDANLLHRAGPRFADGVAQLCTVLDQARANLARH
jgi:iron complex transport system substrate-binding protein